MAQRGRESHYTVLGVPPTASAAEITTAFRKLVRKLHPDAQLDQPGWREQFDLVMAAYAVLHDPRRRAAYDAERTATAPGPPRARPQSVARAPSPAEFHGGDVVVLGPRPFPTVRGAMVRAGPVRVRPPAE